MWWSFMVLQYITTMDYLEGILEPLECGLDKVKKSILAQVIPVWSG